MNDLTPRVSALASLGVVLSLLLWVFAYFSFVYAFGDVMHPDREELLRIVNQRAYLAMVFSILTVVSLLLAIWLSGYTLAVAKVRALVTALSCAAFVAVLLWIYIADNLRAAGTLH